MRYSITIENLGDDLTASFGNGRFLCVDAIVTEGDTFEELVDNAQVFTQDQDGDSGPWLTLGDLSTRLIASYERLIRDEMERLKERK